MSETRVGFITLDWKLNVSAVIALVLAIVSIVFQLTGYWKGAVVTLLPADKVYIVGGKESKRFRIATRMVYTNDGAERYGAIVIREKATLRIGERKIEQWAEERGRLASVEEPDGTRMAKLLDAVDAAPFLVPSAELISHEVFFAPREYGVAQRREQDFVDQPQAIALLREYAKRNATITVVFEARVREVAGFSAGEERTMNTTCIVSLDEGLIRRLEVNGWTARTCQGFARGME